MRTIYATGWHKNRLSEMGLIKIHSCGHRPATIAHFAFQSTRKASDRNLSLPRRARATRAMPSGSPELWALDFDGVACDSCGESSLSAWKVKEKDMCLRRLLVFLITFPHFALSPNRPLLLYGLNGLALQMLYLARTRLLKI